MKKQKTYIIPKIGEKWRYKTSQWNVIFHISAIVDEKQIVYKWYYRENKQWVYEIQSIKDFNRDIDRKDLRLINSKNEALRVKKELPVI